MKDLQRVIDRERLGAWLMRSPLGRRLAGVLKQLVSPFDKAMAGS